MLILMVINEDRDLVMTKYSSRKGVKKITESDHNLMWCNFNIQWSSFLKPDTRVMFNFKENESLEGFKIYNDRNEKLVQCLTNCEDIVSAGRKWFSELKDSMHKCFRKIRCRHEKSDKVLQNLFSQKRSLTKEIKSVTSLTFCTNLREIETTLRSVEDNIANYSAHRNSQKIVKHVETISDASNSLNLNKMWKLRKQLCPKNLEKPSGKLNEKGILVNEKNQLRNLYKETYIKRLSHRQMLPDYETIFMLKNYLFELRIKVCSKIVSPDWTEPQLLKVLKNLKNNKSCDHFGMVYELFKPGVVGKDLFNSLLMLCNEVKIQ